jgi:hypothetical protein
MSRSIAICYWLLLLSLSCVLLLTVILMILSLEFSWNYWFLYFAGRDMRIIVFGFRPKTKQVNSSFFSSLFANYDHLQIEISFTCKIYVVKKYEVHDFEGLNYKLTGERYSFC